MSAALALGDDPAVQAAQAAPEAVQPARDLLRFITCGSVDDGKSTLIGRLLYDANALPDDQLEALDRDSRKFGTQGDKLDLALLVDGLSAEREQGITIDVAYRYFATARRSFIVADTPGHEQYTRNMATGASGAELAIILIDARKGVLAQTRRHSFIVSLVGIRHVVVAVNKMDLVGYDQDRFLAIERDYRALARDLGFEHITVIPISARDGDNVASGSAAMPWYRGPSLFEHLETVDATPAQSAAGFLLPVQWVNRPNLDFRGFAGSIARGSIAPGDEVMVLPGGGPTRVARIVTSDGDLDEAVAGQAVTLVLADELDISRGDVLAGVDQKVAVRSAFSARLLWTSDRPLQSGDATILRLGTATANASVVLSAQIDIHTFREEVGAPDSPASTTLNSNGLGRVTVNLDRPLAVSRYSDNRELGSFILIDRQTNDTVALGVIDAVDFSPAKGTEPATNRSLSWRPRLADLARRAVAPVSSNAGDVVREGLSWRLSSAALVTVTVAALSGNAALAFAAGSTDLVLRPALRGAHRKIWRGIIHRRLSRFQAFNEGDGI